MFESGADNLFCGRRVTSDLCVQNRVAKATVSDESDLGK
jgi:hypothetical protein